MKLQDGIGGKTRPIWTDSDIVGALGRFNSSIFGFDFGSRGYNWWNSVQYSSGVPARAIVVSGEGF